MAKEKFNWKSLFIQEEDASKKETPPAVEHKTPQTTVTTFPTSQDVHNNNNAPSQEILTKVIEMYERGFDSLNKSGYDFYEYFKSVMATDPNNPQSFVMAYTMAHSMDKSIDKTFLLSSADFYQQEIMKVYAKYDEEGKRVKSDLIRQQQSEKQQLEADVKTLQNKIILLQNELEQKSKLLQNFDSNNFGKLQEVDQKILANDLSKDRIMQKISQIISGINTHI